MSLRPAMFVTRVLTVALAAGFCGCATPPSPSASPSPIPSATPPAVAECWVATRNEYLLRPLDGSEVAPADVEDAARVVQARLAAMGLAEYDVSVRDSAVVVLLPSLADDAAVEAQGLITPAGLIRFVPIPDDVSLEPGATLLPGLTPLFGHEAVLEVRVSEDEAGLEALDITLNQLATLQLAEFTRRNVGGQVAIALDDRILSAPVIQSPIETGELQISGPGISAHLLSALMSLPPLPGPLEQTSATEVPRPEGCPV